MSHKVVNICLVSERFDEVAVPLSYELCPPAKPGTLWDESVAYRLAPLTQRGLQRGFAHPHCTVEQLCVSAARTDEVVAVARDVWRAFRVEALPTLQDPHHSGRGGSVYDPAQQMFLTHLQDTAPFATLADGTKAQVPNIAIERTKPLERLQQMLTAATAAAGLHDNVPVGPEGIAAFHPKFPPSNDSSYLWTLNYLQNAAGDKYDPHVSLGATNVTCAAEHIPVFKPTLVPWHDCRLVVAHMGGYCSCFDILS